MIEFKKPSEFSKGTLYNQLLDAYSFNDECKYESVGFKKVHEKENKETPFSGKYIDYELILKK